MAISKSILRKIFRQAAGGIKARGSEEIMKGYAEKRGELEKIGSEMVPNERIEGRPIQISAERIELPVKTVPIIMREPGSEQRSAAPSKTKAPEIKLEEGQELQPAEIKIITEKGSSVAPMIFEFPKLSEELKSRGVLSLKEIEETGKVRGIPLSAHVLPKKEATRKISSDWEPPSFEKINVKYPLIEPYAYSVIRWDEKLGALSYTVIEPPLTKKEQETLEKLKTLIIDLLDINLADVKNIGEVQTYLREKMNQIISDYEIKITEVEYNKILYYIYRNFLGLEEIEPLMQDPEIEDISCDGANIPIFIFHRKYGSLKTNIAFPDQEGLNKFITKLAQRCSKHISVAEPLLDGALPDGSRLQATFSAGGDIAMRGSTFTIRKFTKDPLTIIDFMNFGTIPALISAYLWMAIEYRNSVLVAGGTATGKTSALNSLSLFLPPEVKIVSIEDTPELRLPHEHWIAKVARTGYGPEAEGKKKGEISMFDLLKAALRERPDELIVGEVRGAEAYVLFQGMASVRGSEEVMVVENGKTEIVPIKSLVGRKNFEVVSISPELTAGVFKAECCARHPARDGVYRVKTETGREISVTGDHSLFTVKNGKLTELFASSLKKGDSIAVPSRMPSGFADINFINLTELDGARVLAPSFIKKAVEKIGWKEAGKICGVKSINDYYKKVNCSALKAADYSKLLASSGVRNSLSDVKVKFDRKSKAMPAELKITPELLRLIGYYLSEGSLNTARKNNTIALYNNNEAILEDMRHCIKEVAYGPVKERITKGYGECVELRFSNKVVFELLKQLCGHGSKNKRVPDFVFGLSKEKIAELLSAMYAGDGCLSKKGVQYSTTSKKMASQVRDLLLCFGIISTVSLREKVYRIDFYSEDYKMKFEEFIRPINKNMKHREKRKPRKEVLNDVFLDKIKEIELIKLEKPEPVYDLCVPGTQNFISGGVLLHNTGHAGLATIHAESVDGVVNRLMTKPINLSPGLLQHLDIIVVMGFSRIKGIDVRRIKEVIEIIGVDEKSGKPITNQIFRWVPAGDYYEFASDRSYVLNQIIEEKGIPEESIWAEIQRRTSVLEWMKKQNIRYYKDVGRVIATYYKNPEQILEKIK